MERKEMAVIAAATALGLAGAMLLVLGPDPAGNWESVPLAAAIAGLALLVVAVRADRSAVGAGPPAAPEPPEPVAPKLVGRAGAIMPVVAPVAPVALDTAPAPPEGGRTPAAREPGLSVPLAVVGGGVLALAALRRLGR